MFKFIASAESEATQHMSQSIHSVAATYQVAQDLRDYQGKARRVYQVQVDQDLAI